MAYYSPKLRHVLSLLLLFCLPSSSWAQGVWDPSLNCPYQHGVPKYSFPQAHGGWEAKLIMNGLQNPRGILVDKNGNLLVIESHRSITRLELDDKGGTCMRVRGMTKLFIDADKQQLNRGIALDSENGILYASSKSNVYSWPYDSKQDSLDKTPKLIIEGLDTNPNDEPQSDDEPRLLLSKKFTGYLLVSRGAFGHRFTMDHHHSHEYGQVKAFELARPPDVSAYNYTTDGKPLAWGLWNAVGLAEHPKTGGFWGTNDPNSPQQEGTQPGSELDWLGSFDHLDWGQDRTIAGHFGAAWCPALWSDEREGKDDSDYPSLKGLKPGERFLLSGYGNRQFQMEYPEFEDLDTICKVFRHADHVLAPNSQPTDLVFSPDGSEAIISFRGNARVRDGDGYRLGRVRFNKDGMPAPGPDGTKRGAEDVLTNVGNASECFDAKKPTDACFHPTALATDSSGRVYMVSEPTGEIYVLHLKSQNNSTNSSDAGVDGGGGDDEEDGAEYLQPLRLWYLLGSLYALVRLLA